MPSNRLHHTEVAWVAPPAEDHSPGPWEEEQALYLDQTYRQVLSNPDLSFVDAVFWYEFRDPNPNAQEIEVPGYGSGLVRFDQTAKPAYETYRSLALDPPSFASSTGNAGGDVVLIPSFQGRE